VWAWIAWTPTFSKFVFLFLKFFYLFFELIVAKVVKKHEFFVFFSWFGVDVRIGGGSDKGGRTSGERGGKKCQFR